MRVENAGELILHNYTYFKLIPIDHSQPFYFENRLLNKFFIQYLFQRVVINYSKVN